MAKQNKGGTALGVGKRIREYRKMIGVKGYQFAKTIGISQGSLSDIENENSLPSADTIAKLHQTTPVNIIWVLLGKGSILRMVKEIIDAPLYKMINQLVRIYFSADMYAIGQIKKHFKEIEGRQ